MWSRLLRTGMTHHGPPTYPVYSSQIVDTFAVVWKECLHLVAWLMSRNAPPPASAVAP
jgi:hypothetical protein